MRTNILSISALCAFGILGVSCAKLQPEAPMPEQNQEKVVTTITAKIADSGSRTVLNGTKVNWEDNDKVSVFPKAESSPTDFIVDSFKGNTATFTSNSSLAEADTYYAFYPSSLNPELVSGSTYSINIANNQAYRAGSFASGVNPMIAVSDSKDFAFKNICGVLKINMIGTRSIRQIAFTATDNFVSGPATIDMSSATPTLSFSEEASKTVTLVCDTPVELNEEEPIPFYIVLPANTYSNFQIAIQDGDELNIAIGAASLTIEPSNIKTVEFNIETCQAKDLNDPAHYGKSGSPVYANCYIVSPRGQYYFKAVDGVGSDLAEEVASVDWAWAAGEGWTNNSHEYTEIVKDLVYNSSDKTIRFTAGKTKGNIVLVAKNASGKILWSWHIWNTLKPKDITNNGITMLDRNLGATSAEMGQNGSVGLLYQWGRKDPFIGAFGAGNHSKSVNHEANASPYISGTDPTTAEAGYTAYNIINTSVSGTNWRTTGNAATVQAETEGTQNYMTDLNLLRLPISHVHAASLMPNYNNGAIADWTTYTTANPCPYGYCIPTKTQLQTYIGETKDVNFTIDAVNGGLAAGEAWFPAAGYRNVHTNKGALIGAGYTGRYWTGTADASEKQNGTYFLYYLSGTNQFTGIRKMAIASVRCVKN